MLFRSNDTATTEIYTLSLHDALPISLAQIGIWSYSLYLWKQPFYKVAEIAPWWATPILVAAMFVATLVSFYGVEQPARKYINGLNLFRRRQAIAVV